MKNNTTELVFILDRSGSMSGLKKDTIGGFNSLIEKQKKEKEKYGWEFLFVGANIDSVGTAKNYGIDANRAVDYRADEEGTEVLYGALAESIFAFRENTAISDDWSDEIKKDYESRTN